jgi:hypothetical protein
MKAGNVIGSLGRTPCIPLGGRFLPADHAVVMNRPTLGTRDQTTTPSNCAPRAAHLLLISALIMLHMIINDR